MELNCRTESVLIANLVFEDCAGPKNVVSLEPRCQGNTTQGIIQFLHVEFRNLTISRNYRLLEAIHPSCAHLLMENVIFRENQCGTVGCLFLPMNNTMKDVHVVGNREDENNHATYGRSIFVLSQNSATVATNILASGNEIRLFRVANSTLILRDSHFEGNAISLTNPDARRSVGGSVLLSSNSTVSIMDSIFMNNSGVNGGAIYAFTSDINLTKCIFHENAASIGHGGALFVHLVNASISNSTFLRNSATLGGACYLEKTSVVRTNGVEFAENHSREQGGAIDAFGSTIVMRNASFHKNSVNGDGSAVYLQDGYMSAVDLSVTENSSDDHGTMLLYNSSAVFHRVVFRTNVVGWNGGGLHSSSSNANVTHSTFENNSVSDYGGAIYAAGDSKLQVLDTRLINNSAGDIGGAFYVEESDVVIRRTNITNTTADEGAGCYLNDANTTLESVLFEWNQVTAGSGGGLFAHRGRLNGTSLTFRQNWASESGGGLHAESLDDISLLNVLFQSNTARLGGGGYFSNVSATMRSIKVFKNRAIDGSGGGLYYSEGRLKGDSIMFQENQARESGGGLYVKSMDDMSLLNVHLQNNTGGSGGGAYSSGVNATIEDATLSGNQAIDGPGGGLYCINGRLKGYSLTFQENEANGWGGGVYGEGLDVLSLSRVRFQRNLGISGGAIGIFKSTLSLSNSSVFAENNAHTRGGSIFHKQSQSNISSCHFESDEARYGGSVWIADFSQSNISNCTFSNSTSRSFGGGMQIYNHSRVSMTKSNFSSKRSSFNICHFGVKHFYQAYGFVGCVAHEGGGALSVDVQSILTVSRGTCTGNRARHGASINVVNSTLDVKSSEFKQGQSDRYGGGIVIKDGNLTIQRSNFEGNVASHGSGGGIYMNQGKLDGKWLTFQENEATDWGGGIYASHALTMFLSNVHFQQNRGRFGGAIGALNTPFALSQSCLFIKNHAGENGGSIDQIGSRSNISSCRFENNEARYGGTLWIGSKSQSVILNCTFNNSTSREDGGGVHIFGEAIVSISESSFSSKIRVFTTDKAFLR